MGLTVAVVALALVPAVAQAADTFVDATKPDNTGDCLTPATACQTISGPTGGMTKAGTGDTIFVVDPAVQTTYAENVSLPANKSLVALSPDPDETIIDSGAGASPAIFVPPGGTGSTIQGFTARSNFQALLAQAPVTVQDNIFDEETTPTSTLAVDVQIDSTATGSVVTENSFSDPTPTAGQNSRGLFVGSTSTISNNSFEDMVTSISAGGSAAAMPTISGNEITGTRVGSSAGVGISVSHGNPTIVDNRIDGPFFAAPTDFVTGIFLNALSAGSIPGATLRRNVVIGMRHGIWIEDTEGSVSLEGDLIVQSVIFGLRLVDSGMDDAGPGDATATSLTIVDTEHPDVMVTTEDEIVVDQAVLTLDSTIVGDKGIDPDPLGTCAISFTRGPVSMTSGGCDNFATNSDPIFIDYHLSAASTDLIDAGNPAPPAATVDIDGGPRLVDGDGDPACQQRRDIGADEFVPAVLRDCISPDTTVSGKAKVKTKKKRVRVGFTLGSSEANSSFECSLDGAAFVPCTSPFSAKLKKGTHTLRARAKDAAGNQDASPASFTTKVKRKRPKR